MPPEGVSACVRLLQTVGCSFPADQAARSLSEHGFCQVEFGGGRIDVFLPIIPFYEVARRRRRSVELGDQRVMVWDAETLCVFKMMFFRRKDMADVEEILRVQRGTLDRDWVLQQITAIYGHRDPRLARWEELVRETGGASGCPKGRDQTEPGKLEKVSWSIGDLGEGESGAKRGERGENREKSRFSRPCSTPPDRYIN